MAVGVVPSAAMFIDIGGRGGWRGFEIVSSIASALGGLVIFAIIAATFYFLLRFLIIGTRAAQLYIDRHSPPEQPPARTAPAEASAAATADKTETPESSAAPESDPAGTIELPAPDAPATPLTPTTPRAPRSPRTPRTPKSTE